jgi:hypothetical protein
MKTLFALLFLCSTALNTNAQVLKKLVQLCLAANNYTVLDVDNDGLDDFRVDGDYYLYPLHSNAYIGAFPANTDKAKIIPPGTTIDGSAAFAWHNTSIANIYKDIDFGYFTGFMYNDIVFGGSNYITSGGFIPVKIGLKYGYILIGDCFLNFEVLTTCISTVNNTPITTNQLTSINDQELPYAINLAYGHNSVTITPENNEPLTLELYSIDGRKIAEQAFNSDYNLALPSNQIMILKIRNNKNQVTTYKIKNI